MYTIIMDGIGDDDRRQRDDSTASSSSKGSQRRLHSEQRSPRSPRSPRLSPSPSLSLSSINIQCHDPPEERHKSDNVDVDVDDEDEDALSRRGQHGKSHSADDSNSACSPKMTLDRNTKHHHGHDRDDDDDDDDEDEDANSNRTPPPRRNGSNSSNGNGMDSLDSMGSESISRHSTSSSCKRKESRSSRDRLSRPSRSSRPSHTQSDDTNNIHSSSRSSHYDGDSSHNPRDGGRQSINIIDSHSVTTPSPSSSPSPTSSVAGTPSSDSESECSSSNSSSTESKRDRDRSSRSMDKRDHDRSRRDRERSSHRDRNRNRSRNDREDRDERDSSTRDRDHDHDHDRDRSHRTSSKRSSHSHRSSTRDRHRERSSTTHKTRRDNDNERLPVTRNLLLTAQFKWESMSEQVIEDAICDAFGCSSLKVEFWKYPVRFGQRTFDKYLNFVSVTFESSQQCHEAFARFISGFIDLCDIAYGVNASLDPFTNRAKKFYSKHMSKAREIRETVLGTESIKKEEKESKSKSSKMEKDKNSKDSKHSKDSKESKSSDSSASDTPISTSSAGRLYLLPIPPSPLKHFERLNLTEPKRTAPGPGTDSGTKLMLKTGTATAAPSRQSIGGTVGALNKKTNSTHSIPKTSIRGAASRGNSGNKTNTNTNITTPRSTTSSTSKVRSPPQRPVPTAHSGGDHTKIPKIIPLPNHSHNNSTKVRALNNTKPPLSESSQSAPSRNAPTSTSTCTVSNAPRNPSKPTQPTRSQLVVDTKMDRNEHPNPSEPPMKKRKLTPNGLVNTNVHSKANQNANGMTKKVMSTKENAKDLSSTTDILRTMGKIGKKGLSKVSLMHHQPHHKHSIIKSAKAIQEHAQHLKKANAANNIHSPSNSHLHHSNPKNNKHGHHQHPVSPIKTPRSKKRKFTKTLHGASLSPVIRHQRPSPSSSNKSHLRSPRLIPKSPKSPPKSPPYSNINNVRSPSNQNPRKRGSHKVGGKSWKAFLGLYDGKDSLAQLHFECMESLRKQLIETCIDEEYNRIMNLRNNSNSNSSKPTNSNPSTNSISNPNASATNGMSAVTTNQGHNAPSTVSGAMTSGFAPSNNASTLPQAQLAGVVIGGNHTNHIQQSSTNKMNAEIGGATNSSNAMDSTSVNMESVGTDNPLRTPQSPNVNVIGPQALLPNMSTLSTSNNLQTVTPMPFMNLNPINPMTNVSIQNVLNSNSNTNVLNPNAGNGNGNTSTSSQAGSVSTVSTGLVSNATNSQNSNNASNLNPNPNPHSVPSQQQQQQPMASYSVPVPVSMDSNQNQMSQQITGTPSFPTPNYNFATPGVPVPTWYGSMPQSNGLPLFSYPFQNVTPSLGGAAPSHHAGTQSLNAMNPSMANPVPMTMTPQTLLQKEWMIRSNEDSVNGQSMLLNMMKSTNASSLMASGVGMGLSGAFGVGGVGTVGTVGTVGSVPTVGSVGNHSVPMGTVGTVSTVSTAGTVPVSHSVNLGSQGPLVNGNNVSISSATPQSTTQPMRDSTLNHQATMQPMTYDPSDSMEDNVTLNVNSNDTKFPALQMPQFDISMQNPKTYCDSVSTSSHSITSVVTGSSNSNVLTLSSLPVPSDPASASSDSMKSTKCDNVKVSRSTKEDDDGKEEDQKVKVRSGQNVQKSESKSNGKMKSNASDHGKDEKEEDENDNDNDDDGDGDGQCISSNGQWIVKKHSSGCSRTEGHYNLAPSKSRRKFLPNLHRAQGRRRDDGEARDLRLHKRSLMATMKQTNSATVFRMNSLQFRQKKIQFGKSSIHSWGVFALEDIAADEMVVEYIGEYITCKVADQREKVYQEQGYEDYLFRVTNATKNGEDLIIDATKKGNLARFINHSCMPNCVTKIIQVNGTPRVVIYSKKMIPLGEEITYDYFFEKAQEGEAKILCNCKSIGCKKYLN